MHIGFRQGIIYHNLPEFIQVNASSVNLIADHNNPLLCTVSTGSSNYLITEPTTIPNAWSNIPLSNSWLYIDIDKLTANRTFGFTTIEPITGPVQPSNPQINQHWFDTESTTMYVYQNSIWQPKIRIFMCMLQSGSLPISMSINSPTFTGTQAGIIGDFAAGYIMFDPNNKPVRITNDEFATTETLLKTGPISNTELKLASLVLEAVADVSMAKYTIVQVTGMGKIGPANAYTTVTAKQYGIIEQLATSGQITNYTTTGNITNVDWDWTNIGPNAFLYVDNNGQLIETPTIPSQAPVAIVVDIHTISLNIKNIITNINQPPQSSGINQGTVRLSVPPISSIDPIAVGDNDPRMYDDRPPTTHSHLTSDISNLNSVLNTKLSISGGTLTGPLILNADPTLSLGAATKQYVDNINLISLNDVNITSLTTGQILSYNGTNWVNANAPSASVTLTGDISGTGVGTVSTLLNDVNTNVGTFGSASAVGIFTVTSKGRITAASNIPIQITWSNVLSKPTTLFGFGITDAAPLTHTTDTNLHLTNTQRNLLNSITASATEINYTTGVTSNIQTQLNAKISNNVSTTFSTGVNLTLTNGELFGLPSIPTAGSSAVSKTYVDDRIAAGVGGVPVVLAGSGLIFPSGSTLEVDNGTELTFAANKLTLTTTGITAGTYKSLTIDTYGRATGGTNPTTLNGFGITDALVANTTITGGTATKITYDSKGLILSGTTLVQGDIPNITQSQVINLTSDLNDKQPLNSILTSISGLTGNNGYLFVDSSGLWSISTLTLNTLLPTQTGNGGKFLTTDGSSTSWATVSSGGSPGGSTTQLQYNNAGVFAGATGITTDGTNLTINGNLTLSGSNRKLLADYSTVVFQTSVSNNVTILRVIPNGTTTQSGISFYNTTDVSNSSLLTLGTNNSQSYIQSTKTNTGIFLPLSIQTSDVERIKIDTAGNIVLGAGALATPATDGFVYIPITDGVPTGVPTTYAGHSPLVVDTTNNRLYGYDIVENAWLNLTGGGSGGGGATLTLGTHLTGTSYNGSTAVTVNVTANSANTASTIVSRDAVGNFNAGTITASLNGNASTVTDGVYTTGTYADPSWITSLSGTKISGNITGSAASLTSTLSISSGGTGATTASAAFNALAPTQTGNGGKFLTTNGSSTSWATVASGGGSGTVTSIDVSGGTTGLTTSGGPITASGTITLDGTLSIANGGTGATTVTNAINALLPSQTSHNTHVLTTNGTNISWSAAGSGSGGTTTNALTIGSYLTGGSFDGSAAITVAVDATSANTASKVVARDVSGNFNAGIITASLSGNASTATTATNVTGIVAIANGGTGLSTLGTSNQLIRVNSGATGLEFFTASGGAGSPGGTIGQLQYYSGGLFAGSSIETDGNNLTFVGNGRMLYGQLSDSVLSNNLSIQSSTINGTTHLNILPNGTNTISELSLFNVSTPDNAGYISIQSDTSQGSIIVGKTGTGTFTPLHLNVGGVRQVQISAISSAINYINLQGAATGAPMINVLGSDTNIPLSLKAKGTSAVRIDSTGTNALFNIGGSTLSTGSAGIQVGTGRTGSGTSYIDFVGDTTYTDYGLRVIRNNTGANATSQISHRGLGTLSIETVDTSNIVLSTSSVQRFTIDASGNTIIGTGALTTTATNGFLYIPTTPGTPTGIPTTYTGRGAVVYDTTNNNLYLYDPVDNSWSNLTGAGSAGSAAGSTGSVQFNVSNVISGSTNFIWDNVNNRLGINQGTPTVALDVVGAIKASTNVSCLTLTSTQTTGTAPFTVSSTTVVSNLNADLLDGQHGTYYQNATNINAGTLPTVRGGTGLAAVGTINQILGVTTLGGNLEYKNITGGSNIVVSYSSGNITITGTSKGVPGGTSVSDSTGDPYFSYVSLLAHFDGTNGSTSMSDVKGHIITNAGTVISTAQFKYNNSSALFNGTSARLDISSSSDFGMETGDFTIELSIYPISLSGNRVLLDTRASDPDVAILIYTNGTGNIAFNVNGTDVILDPTPLSINTWYDIALVKSAGVTKLYKNSAQVGSSYSDTHFYGAARAITIGDRFDTTHLYFNGYIDELRISKGVARSIVPLTQAFPDVQSKAKGSIQYNNAGGFYGDSNIIWDGINNRLGINQSTPTQALHVVGNIKIEGVGTSLTFNDGTSFSSANVTSVANGTVTNTQITPRVVTVSYAASVTLNWAIADVIKITLTGNIVITNSGAVNGQKCLLELTQDGTGNRTIAFTSETVSHSSIIYTPSTTPSVTDRLGIIYDTTSNYTIIAALGSTLTNSNSITSNTVQLVAGTATVNLSTITATSKIFLTSQIDGGTPGFLRISSRVDGVSFTILSSSNTDTSTVAWMLV